jgi:glutamine synthetase
VQLPITWDAAIDAFEKDTQVARILPRGLIRNFVMTKRQELQYFLELSGEERIDLYLDTV